MTNRARSGRGRRGQAALFITLSLPVLFGLTALVVDLGWAHYRKQAAKTAAEAAAMAAGNAGYSAANLNCGSGVICQSETACPENPTVPPANNLMSGCLYARANGFTPGDHQTVTMAANVTAPPVPGVSPHYWVSATASENNVPMVFLALFGRRFLTVRARATAGVYRQSGGCVYVLQTTGTGIAASGTPVLESGCGVYVNSTSSSAVALSGSAGIRVTNGAKVKIAGNWTHSGNGYIAPDPEVGAPVVPDPFESLQAPTVGSCNSTGVNLTSGQSHTFTQSENVICGAINLSGSSGVTFQPGLYVLKGSINMSGQTSLSGTGVTLYMQSGAINMSGGATVNLSASAGGTYSGILIFQDRNNTSGANLTGGAAQIMNGVLYFPNSAMRYTGGSSTAATSTTIVAKSLTMTGNSYIKQAASTPYTGILSGVYLLE